MISQRLQLNISNTQEPKQGLLVESGLISEIPSSKWWNVACPSLWVSQNIVRGQNRSISTVALRDASNSPVGGWMLARREPLMPLYHTTTLHIPSELPTVSSPRLAASWSWIPTFLYGYVRDNYLSPVSTG